MESASAQLEVTDKVHMYLAKHTVKNKFLKNNSSGTEVHFPVFALVLIYRILEYVPYVPLYQEH